VAWGIQSGGVSSSIGFNLSLYLESRATPGISASALILLVKKLPQILEIITTTLNKEH
jgi:hypothetical protein